MKKRSMITRTHSQVEIRKCSQEHRKHLVMLLPERGCLREKLGTVLTVGGGGGSGHKRGENREMLGESRDL